MFRYHRSCFPLALVHIVHIITLDTKRQRSFKRYVPNYEICTNIMGPQWHSVLWKYNVQGKCCWCCYYRYYHVIIARTYDVVVFHNEPLEAGVTQLHDCQHRGVQLSNTSR